MKIDKHKTKDLNYELVIRWLLGDYGGFGYYYSD